MFNIMVVEDDAGTRKLMKTVIGNAGYNVVTACDGVDALEVLDKTQIDLIVLDNMMPRMNGYDFTKNLRNQDWFIPILMVTAKETYEDKKRGFLAGTDDYMTKPINEEEMLLRIAALLRRSKISTEKKIVVGETLFDYSSLTYNYRKNTIELPLKEFMLIFKLLSYQNKIFTRRQLMDEIWGMDNDTDERTVDVHINRLREKFKDNNDFEIVTIRGLGYKAVVNVEKQE